MSELRTNYPRAKAWTYVIDTPPSGTSAPVAARAEAAATGRRRAGSREAETRHKKNSSLLSSGGGSTNTRGGKVQGDSMGGLCSSSKKNVDNKENAGDLEDAPFITVGAMVPGATLVDAASGANLKATRAANKLAYADRGVDREERRLDQRLSDPAGDLLLMDTTAFLSPDPEDSAGARDVAAEIGDDIGGAGEMNFEDEGGFVEEEGDRTAWLARNMGLLRGGSSVDVAQIKQVAGLEDSLHELFTERTRHLKAMETLTSQLRRREADADKAAHDLKALTARLECSEQDKASLEHRARAAGEEHRVERARWFVHKQELETRCVQLESRDTQYRASIRKKEVEYGRLQDSMRRAVQKDSRGTKSVHRGIEANFELSPGQAGTEGGREALGGVVNKHALRKAEDLQKENVTLRNMLVDLQADVVDLKGYQDRHGDLVSAGRVGGDDGIWGSDGEVVALPGEAVEGMPADWLQKKLGEDTARQIMGMRGALARVLGDGEDGALSGEVAGEDLTSLVSQLREARSLLREQDAIMLAAIFDRPCAEAAVSNGRQLCVCGGIDGGGALGGSGVWDSLERIEQEREELARERSKLEKEKARFLEDAVRRDRKNFVFSCPPGTPGSPDTPGVGGNVDVGLTTPSHFHRHLAATGTLMVPNSPGLFGGDGGGLPLLTFTPPGASPDTARLLGELGIRAGVGDRGTPSPAVKL